LVAELVPVLQECSPAEYREFNKDPCDTLSSNQPIIPAENKFVCKMKDVETQTADPKEEKVGVRFFDILLVECILKKATSFRFRGQSLAQAGSATTSVGRPPSDRFI